MKKLTVTQHARIQMVFYAAAAILALVSYFNDVSRLPLWLAIICVIAGVVWRAVFIKCPYCGDGLTGSRKIPKCCPNCGNSLSTNPTEEDK